MGIWSGLEEELHAQRPQPTASEYATIVLGDDPVPFSQECSLNLSCLPMSFRDARASSK